MKKGQNELELMLICAAILAISVVVVIVAESMINIDVQPAPQETIEEPVIPSGTIAVIPICEDKVICYQVGGIDAGNRAMAWGGCVYVSKYSNLHGVELYDKYCGDDD